MLKDDKENSEHMMLVDLARNDLSRSCKDVVVEKDREIQFYSHVIHLVSKVTGTLKSKSKEIIGNTFPAGTLTGAPKYKAMELINHYETSKRQFYGGAIGMIDIEGNFNHAIIIRSFLSKNQSLHWFRLISLETVLTFFCLSLLLTLAKYKPRWWLLYRTVLRARLYLCGECGC